MQRGPCHAVDRHHGLTLIGDANGGNRFADSRAHRLQCGAHGLPDFLGVMLDPAGLRIVLCELAIVGD